VVRKAIDVFEKAEDKAALQTAVRELESSYLKPPRPTPNNKEK